MNLYGIFAREGTCEELACGAGGSSRPAAEVAGKSSDKDPPSLLLRDAGAGQGRFPHRPRVQPPTAATDTPAGAPSSRPSEEQDLRLPKAHAPPPGFLVLTLDTTLPLQTPVPQAPGGFTLQPKGRDLGGKV